MSHYNQLKSTLTKDTLVAIITSIGRPQNSTNILSNDNMDRKYTITELAQGIPLTISLVSWLITVIPSSNLSSEEFAYWHNQIVKSLTQPLPSAKKPLEERKDRRGDIISAIEEPNFIPKIYSDYEYGRNAILGSTNFPVVEDINDADFIFTHLRITNFYDLPQYLRVNQFPYEGGFVRKDLLILTVRGYCYVHTDSKDRDAGIPRWFLPCFDLNTEFHYFMDELERRYQRGNDDHTVENTWIIKPAIGTRAVGHQILRDPRMMTPSTSSSVAYGLQNMLVEAALLAPKLSYSSILQEIVASQASCTTISSTKALNNTKVDRVAQLLVSHPLLVRGLKFDLRIYVFVRSFVPFEAYLHRHHYARLANKPYDQSSLDDNEVVLTVNAYNVDEKIAERQTRIYREDLKEELLSEYPALDYAGMMNTMVMMLSELFQGISTSAGHWPSSSAYYAIDVIFDTHDAMNMDDGKFIPQAKLIEVNFIGDMEAGRLGSKTVEEYDEWVHDMITCLATKRVPHPDRHTRLG